MLEKQIGDFSKDGKSKEEQRRIYLSQLHIIHNKILSHCRDQIFNPSSLVIDGVITRMDEALWFMNIRSLISLGFLADDEMNGFIIMDGFEALF